MASAGVTVGTYLYAYEADIALGLLRSFGFDGWIMLADGAGWQPHLNYIQGVRLLTPPDQADEARALLESPIERQEEN